MQKIFSPARAATAWLLLMILSAPGAKADDKPVFDMDCVSFAGRFLANAPVKKKAYKGLAVDGTAWTLTPDKRVQITKVFPGEAAERAGIVAGDEVVTINGYATQGMELRDIFAHYHLYDPDALTETIEVQKKDGTRANLKLQLLTIDACNPEERRAWQEFYKGWGY